jgi:galactokinase/mevalonate kinase-like predicted kinase
MFMSATETGERQMKIDRGVLVASAPGRCGIIGNPSDMYGGSVISISTWERATCELAAADRLVISCGDQQAVINSPEDLQQRGDNLDIARAVLAFLNVEPAEATFSLELSTEIPMQAGMAGSTALVVACLGVLDRYLGLKLHPWAMAETARKIEFRQMGVLCGLQDQHMAVFGGLNFLDFHGKEMLEQRADEPLATVESLLISSSAREIPLLAANTGVRHNSGAVHRSPRQRWLDGDKTVIDAFERIGNLARQGKRALLERNWELLGALMNENHSIIQKLGGSGPANDNLIDAARQAGAYGAKLAGAGGGGTIIALAPDIERVGCALRKAGAVAVRTVAPGEGLTVELRQNPL